MKIIYDYYKVLRSCLSACNSLALILHMLQLHEILALQNQLLVTMG